MKKGTADRGVSDFHLRVLDCQCLVVLVLGLYMFVYLYASSLMCIYIRTYIYIAYPKLARPAYALYPMNAYLLEQVGGLVEGMWCRMVE